MPKVPMDVYHAMNNISLRIGGKDGDLRIVWKFIYNSRAEIDAFNAGGRIILPDNIAQVIIKSNKTAVTSDAKSISQPFRFKYLGKVFNKQPDGNWLYQKGGVGNG